MSITQPPVPYTLFAAEQQARIQAEQERDQWHERYKQEQVARIQAERQRDQERQLWQTKFKSTEKLMIIELQRQLDEAQAHDEQGYFRFDEQAAAANIGRSVYTPTDIIENLLSQCDDLPLETTTHDEYDEEAQTTLAHLYLKATGNLIEAAIASKIRYRKIQGGNRYEPRWPWQKQRGGTEE